MRGALSVDVHETGSMELAMAWRTQVRLRQSGEALLDVGQCLRRTDSGARFLESFEKSGFSSVDRQASVAADGDEVESRG